MRRSLLPCLLGILLAACDTGTQDHTGLVPGDIVGTWTVDRSESTVFVTVDEAQDIPDLSLPAQTGFTLSGAASGSLGTVLTFGFYGDEGVALQAADAPNDPGIVLEMQISSFEGAFFDLSLAPGFNQYAGRFESDQLGPFTFDRLGVGIDAVALDANRAPPGQVVVDGRLAFATRRAAAGSETEIRGPHAGTGRARLIGSAQTVRFDSGGALTLTFPVTSRERTGRWEIAGDSLTLSLDATDTESAESTTYRAFAPADRLLFTRTDRRGGSEAAETRYLVEPGTLSGVRLETSADLSR